MRCIIVIVGALLALLSWGGVSQAGVAGGNQPLSRAAMLGEKGLVQQFISAGTVQENTPMLLAKKRRWKRSGKGGFASSAGGAGALQVDPNTAERTKLMMLPLLTPEEADAIIAYRLKERIDTPEEMLEINGVKPSHYRIFKHLIVIRAQEVPKELQVATGEVGAATELTQLSTEPPPQLPQNPQEPQRQQ